MPSHLRTAFSPAGLFSASSDDMIRGVTVAEAGVIAKGHFITFDKKGQITGDPELVHTRLPMATDEKTLTTLMAAAKAAGGEVKTREDHDDSLGARIGTVSNFKLEDGKVTADLDVFKAYRNRDLLFEIRQKSPEKMGLSIDFTFEVEVRDQMAFVRVVTLEAVDVVDEGAITPKGLFRSISGSEKTKTKPTMAKDKTDDSPDDTAPGHEEVLAAVKALAGKCDAIHKGHEKILGHLAKHEKKLSELSSKIEPAATDDALEMEEGDDALGVNDEETEEEPEREKPTVKKEGTTGTAYKAKFAALDKQLKALQAEQLKLRQTNRALGIRAGARAEEIEETDEEREANAAALKAKQTEALKKKGFKAMVDAAVAGDKTGRPALVVRSDAVSRTVRENPEAYRDYLAAKGIIRIRAAA